MKILRLLFSVFIIFGLLACQDDTGGEPASKDTGSSLSKITMNGTQGTRFDIDWMKNWPLSYSIEPASLQNQVTVKYTVINPPSGAPELLVFDSDASENANTVKASANPAANVTYNLRAAATYDDGTGAVTKNTNFTVRLMPFENLISVSAANIAMKNTATISYTIQPVSLQNTAEVTCSSTNSHLTFSGNRVTADDQASGVIPVTITAVHPSYPENKVSGTFTVTIRETTKNYENRGGQSLANIASIYGNTANNVTVSAIDNLSTYSQQYLENYILGVDMGTLIEVEAAGGRYYDVDGYEVADVFELLSDYGINWVRVRIWHHPYKLASDTNGSIGDAFGGGTNDLEKGIELSRRAKQWGMNVKLDFHYSDFWAHPGQQSRPRPGSHIPRGYSKSYNWPQSGTAAQVGSILQQYTFDTLMAMHAAGVLPDMVQVGNENTSGIAGFTSVNDQNVMYRAGVAAVRQVEQELGIPKIRVMLHATNGTGTITTFFNNRAAANPPIDYDVVGISFYPMWHGNRTSFQSLLTNLANTHGKEICVAEYSSAYTTRTHTWLEDKSSSNTNQQSFTGGSAATERTFLGQANLIRNMNSDIMRYAVTGGRNLGIGSFWWEPAWLPLQAASWARNTAREWYVWQATAPGGSSGDSNQPRIQPPQSTWANQGFFTYEGTVSPSVNAFLQMMGKQTRIYTIE